MRRAVVVACLAGLTLGLGTSATAAAILPIPPVPAPHVLTAGGTTVIADRAGTAADAALAPDDAPAADAAWGNGPVDAPRYPRGYLPLDRLGEPSQQYLDAMAHAHDRLALEPFRPVTVQLPARTNAAGKARGSAPAGASAPGAASAPAGASASGAPSAPGAASGTSLGPSAAGVVPHALVNPSGLRREVMGFLPYWYLGDPDLTLNWSVLSTVVYFGLSAGSDGHILRTSSDGTPEAGWQGWQSGNLTNVVDQAHQHDTRVTVSVERFSWTSAQTAATVALLGSADARTTLVNEVVGLVTSRGLDGVNLDFEPIPAGQSDNFVALVRQFRAALDAAAPGYGLTFDSTAELGNYDVPNLTAPGAADAVFIMGYDYRTATSGTAGSVDPLGGPRYDLQDTVTAFLGETAASKIILGIPYYGRAWSTVSNALDAKTLAQNATNGYSASVPYDSAVSVVAQHTRSWDPIEQTPWAAYQWQSCSSCPTVWRQLYYDDAQSLGLRYDLVNRMNLRGAGMWALGMDGARPELYRTLANKFLTDTTPPDAGIVALPESVDSASFPVSWTALDDWSGIASYDVQVSADGGAWTAWLTATGQTSATYSGRTGHGYAFRVRATDGKGNAGPWDVTATWIRTPVLAANGFAQVVQGPLNIRSAATVGAQVLGQVNTGDIIAITGGPVSADGYTWWRGTAPVAQWGPVDLVHTGVWFAGSGNGTVFLAPRQAPNATTVNTEIGALGFAAIDAAGGALSALPPSLATGFSPNGDGHADALRISYRLRLPLNALELRVTRATDLAPLGSVPLPGLASGDQQFDWDGRIAGQVVPDGPVYLQLVGRIASTTYVAPGSDLTDATIQDEARVVVDTTPPSLSAPALSSPAFSPNGDGSRDTATVSATVGGGGVAWTVAILDPSGAPLRSWSGTGTAPTATWDGHDGAGNRVPDGTYAVLVTAQDAYANAASVGATLVVDTVVPAGTFAVTASTLGRGALPYVFSPNGDGYADIASFAWSASKPVAGTVRVLSGTSVRWSRAFAAPVSGSVAWNGRTTSGTGVADGTYRVEVRAADAAGNPFVRTATVVVDRLASSLAASPNRFYPQDGDTLAQTARISFRLARTGSTVLRVLDGAGRVVRTAWSGRRLAAGTYAWTFDGRSATGAWLPQGDYLVQLIASDAVGRVVIAKPLSVGAFMVRTSLSGSPGALTLVVDAWSAEPLRAKPSIGLALAGGPTLAGSVADLGAGHYRVTFADPALGGTATLVLAATDTGGRANRMSLTVALS